jgi:hypothetical protein
MKRRLRLAIVMFMNRRIRLGILLLLSATVATPQLLAQRPAAIATLAPLPTATPESVGFAPGALDKMDAGMQDLVDKKQLAGIVTLVARHGKVVQHKAYGVQSLETGCADEAGHDRAHLLDDQADHRRGDDDVVRRRASGSRPIRFAKHIPGVRQPEGLRG